MFKRITALVVCAAMIMTFAACADTTYSIQIGDRKINPGVYILCQFDAIEEMRAVFTEEHPGVDITLDSFKFDDYTLEGISVADWIKKRALELTVELLVIEEVFNEKGLFFTIEEETRIQSEAEYMWDLDIWAMFGGYAGQTWGELYGKSGIGKESYIYYHTTQSKYEKVFDSIYGEGGSNPVPEAEWQEIWVKDYARVRILEIDITDGFGGVIPEGELNELAALGKEYAARLNSGESFGSVREAYWEYINPHVHDEFCDHDDHGHVHDENCNHDEVLGAEEHLDEFDEHDGHVHDEDDEFDEHDDEHSDNGEHVHGDDCNHDDFYEADDVYDRFVAREGSNYDEGFVNHIFSMGYGNAEFYETEHMYYVVVRLDNLENEDHFENYRKRIVFDLKFDEFSENNKALARAKLNTDIIVNDAAVKRYDPKKLF
ncbi:MAG: hypothetical protein FWD34_00985 [Oscillospiraceae bacterium]|nr:hypothetical protein [Oscillospiraceae bacterium]